MVYMSVYRCAFIQCMHVSTLVSLSVGIKKELLKLGIYIDTQRSKDFSTLSSYVRTGHLLDTT